MKKLDYVNDKGFLQSRLNGHELIRILWRLELCEKSIED